jgi:hypothetical protein
METAIDRDGFAFASVYREWTQDLKSYSYSVAIFRTPNNLHMPTTITGVAVKSMDEGKGRIADFYRTYTGEDE